MPETIDQQWAGMARATRAALHQLGWGTPYCLPDEPEACGGSYAEHTAAHLAALKAVADHHLAHLAPRAQLVDEIYLRTGAELHGRSDCQLPSKESGR